MVGHRCIVCGNNSLRDPHCSFHRFANDMAVRVKWLQMLGINKSVLKKDSRVCSRHFPAGDVSKGPQINLGKRFASPIKKKLPRAQRAKCRELFKETLAINASSSSSSSLVVSDSSTDGIEQPQSLTTVVGEQLCPDYVVHELPTDTGDSLSETHCDSAVPSEVLSQSKQSEASPSSTEVLVSNALLARIEVLEAENAQLKANLAAKTPEHFRIEQIQHNDKLFCFYTGFVSYEIFLAFFEFLGPVVNELNYWDSKKEVRQRHYKCKLNPVNQLFLTLIKLRLNLKSKDLSFRFGISTGLVSQYTTTWICFLHHHFKELNWLPSVEQVKGTLPHVFEKSYPNTYAIIDGTEIFIETPSDLFMQSSTWSQYKHHNTAKFLVACTPNGAISFISPVFVGSISDVQLTSSSGFLVALEDKPGISIMADRGFTIKDSLNKLNIDLNLPPFMEGKSQLPSKQVSEGRKISSLRIHVERAIGRIKLYAILREVLPISMARIINQIVSVCAFLTNFQPALVPPPQTMSDSEVEGYLMGLDETDNESESDSSCNEL